MGFESFKVLEANTTHVTPNDVDILEDEAKHTRSKVTLVVYDYEEGFFIYLDPMIHNSTLQERGLSEMFCNLYRKAIEDHYSKFLNLDRDATIYDELSVSDEWE